MRRNKTELSPLSEIRPSMRRLSPTSHLEAVRGLVVQLQAPGPEILSRIHLFTGASTGSSTGTGASAGPGQSEKRRGEGCERECLTQTTKALPRASSSTDNTTTLQHPARTPRLYAFLRYYLAAPHERDFEFNFLHALRLDIPHAPRLRNIPRHPTRHHRARGFKLTATGGCLAARKHKNKRARQCKRGKWRRDIEAPTCVSAV